MIYGTGSEQSTMADNLQLYRKKRDFHITSEPQGGRATEGALSFVIQKHAARRLHYDFRLELDGTLKSWAVPKGPSLDPADKRMAVHVEDHPLDYGSFEGVIPPKQYGAGTVIVWDRGEWLPIGDPHAGYKAGKLKFELRGEKLQGRWTLVRMHGRADERQEPWLLIKERDEAARPAAEYSIVEALPDSVLTGTAQPRKATAAASKITSAKSGAAKKAAAAQSLRQATAAAKTSTKKLAAKKAPMNKASAKTQPTETAASNKTSGKKAAATSKSKPTEKTSARKTSAAKSTRTSFDATLPAGARKAKLPLTLAPQLATLVDRAPTEGDWLYEIKFDGYRLLTRIEGGDVRLFTRNGHDWTSKLKSLARAIAALKLPDAWLDGEIVVQGPRGVPDFQLLQNAFDTTRTQDILYFVFDLPYYAAHDLREVPLHARRELLRDLLDTGAAERVRFSEDFAATPQSLLHTACEMRMEGLIGKRANAIYVSRRAPSWIKLKCTQRQEFVIGGFTEPKGSRVGLGSLLLGVHDANGELKYAGNVGTGFNAKVLQNLSEKLEALRTERSPFAAMPKGVKSPGGKPKWVKPKLVAEISFAEWTKDGRVRHSVFHGLRSDKPAEGITREKPSDIDAAKGTSTEANVRAPAAKPSRSRTRAPARTRAAVALPAGLRITHPERVVDASTGVTKLELMQYYARAAQLMLPHLKQRPVSLVRAPEGIGGELFFQKHGAKLRIPGIKQLDPSFDTDHQPLLEIPSAQALIGAVQMNVIEFHTWNATTRAIEQPDRMTFDLDPGEDLLWPKVREAAELVRVLLDELGLQSLLKTSGGKGLHIIVPFKPGLGWNAVKALSQSMVQHLARTLPDRFVSKSGPRNRVGKIFVDYLRNGRGATTVAAWSVRARPGLGISVPVDWSELPTLSSGAHWTVRNIDARLDLPNRLHGEAALRRQSLNTAIKTLDFIAPRN
jgi:bifunctional non-homologous end joining protein LigD